MFDIGAHDTIFKLDDIIGEATSSQWRMTDQEACDMQHRIDEKVNEYAKKANENKLGADALNIINTLTEGYNSITLQRRKNLKNAQQYQKQDSIQLPTTLVSLLITTFSDDVNNKIRTILLEDGKRCMRKQYVFTVQEALTYEQLLTAELVKCKDQQPFKAFAEKKSLDDINHTQEEEVAYEKIRVLTNAILIVQKRRKKAQKDKPCNHIKVPLKVHTALGDKTKELEEYSAKVKKVNSPRLGAGCQKEARFEVYRENKQIVLHDARNIDSRVFSGETIWVPDKNLATGVGEDAEYCNLPAHMSCFLFTPSSSPGLVRYTTNNTPLDIDVCAKKDAVLPAVQCYWNEVQVIPNCVIGDNYRNHTPLQEQYCITRVSNDLTHTDVHCLHPDNQHKSNCARSETQAPFFIDRSSSHMCMTYQKLDQKYVQGEADGIVIYELPHTQRMYTIDKQDYIDVQKQKYERKEVTLLQDADKSKFSMTALALGQVSPLFMYSLQEGHINTIQIRTLPRTQYSFRERRKWFFFREKYIEKKQAPEKRWQCSIQARISKIMQIGYCQFLALSATGDLYRLLHFDYQKREPRSEETLNVTPLLSAQGIQCADIAFDPKNHAVALLLKDGTVFATASKNLVQASTFDPKDSCYKKIEDTRSSISVRSDFDDRACKFARNDPVQLKKQTLSYYNGTINIWNEMEVRNFSPFPTTSEMTERGRVTIRKSLGFFHLGYIVKEYQLPLPAIDTSNSSMRT